MPDPWPRLASRLIAFAGDCWHSPAMSMAEIMREVAAWPRKRQDELAAFILHLRLQHDPEWRKEMARRIDDKTPANWISLEEVKKSLLPKRRAR